MLYIFTSLIIFAGSLVQGSTGFGFAIVCMAILPLFLPFEIATITVLLLATFYNFQVVIRMRKQVNYKIIIYPIIFGFIGRILGFKILMYYNDNILKLILGLILIFFSFFFIFFNSKIKIKPTRINGSIAGSLSGISGGICNVAGPPLVIYYLNVIETKEKYYATANTTYLITNIFNIFLHLFSQNISLEILKHFTAGILSVIIGFYIGIIIFKKLDRKMLSTLIYIAMIIMGIRMIFFK